MTKKTLVSIIAGLCLLDISLHLFIFKLFFAPIPKPESTPKVIQTSIQAPSNKDEGLITLRAVGDIMLGRAVNLQSQKHQDFTWPFQQTIPYLKPVDFFIGNLENPLVTNCPNKSDGMIFCAPVQAAKGLAYANLNLVSLANNHTLNYGTRGLEETKVELDQLNIKYLQHKQSVVTSINSIPIRFVAYDDLTYPLTKLEIESYPEITIAYIHWGAEYLREPTSRQKLVASWLLEQGVDVILGSHPHVLQPIEQPQPNQLVAYSLGNFIFDQMWSESTRIGTILDLRLHTINNQLATITYTQAPTYIFDYGQPHLNNQ